MKPNKQTILVLEAKDLIQANSTIMAGILIFLTVNPILKKEINKTNVFDTYLAAGLLLGIFSASSIVALFEYYISLATGLFAIGLIALTFIVLVSSKNKIF